MASELILGEDTQKQLEGSFEALGRRVEKVIVAESAKLFGADKTPSILGTFADHALVLIKESGEVVRVRYETSQLGDIVPIAATVADLSTYTPDQAAKKTAKAFVEAFLSNAPSTGAEEFRKFASLSENASFPTRAVRDLSRLEEGIAKAAWNKFFDEKKEEIAKVVGESKSEWTPKFRKLHDGSVSSKEIGQFEGLVTSDLKYMSERVHALLANTSEAAETYSKTENKAPELLSFAEDLVQDLTWVRNTLSETLESSKPIDVKSKIYDVLASELNRYEVASSFIANMSRSLNQAATEEA